MAAGSVMEWIDKAGYACAVGWSGSYCVTAYVGNVLHRRPIAPGSLVEAHARLIHTGRTSMHVLVTVSSADVSTREFRAATTCILIFVAKGSDGRPAAVRPWVPRSRSDKKLASVAVDHIDARATIKDLMLDDVFAGKAGARGRTLRFLVPPGVVNWGGNAHGGTVMRWIDEAAYVCAASWAGEDEAASDAVAVYSGGIHFFAPVRIGELVEINAQIVYPSTHSMHISIRVHTADPRRPDEMTLTTQCLSVFVVPDGDGGTRPVPQWTPSGDEELSLWEHARDIVQLRERIVPISASLARED